MQEFLLLIWSEEDYCEKMTAEQHQAHLQKVGRYIERLTKEGKFISAQPLQMSGSMMRRVKGVFKDGPFNETKEVILGYFNILAQDLGEAKEIAKANPIFEDTDAWMEIRLIKHEEGVN